MRFAFCTRNVVCGFAVLMVLCIVGCTTPPVARTAEADAEIEHVPVIAVWTLRSHFTDRQHAITLIYAVWADGTMMYRDTGDQKKFRIGTMSPAWVHRQVESLRAAGLFDINAKSKRGLDTIIVARDDTGVGGVTFYGMLGGFEELRDELDEKLCRIVDLILGFARPQNSRPSADVLNGARWFRGYDVHEPWNTPWLESLAPWEEAVNK